MPQDIQKQNFEVRQTKRLSLAEVTLSKLGPRWWLSEILEDFADAIACRAEEHIAAGDFEAADALEIVVSVRGVNLSEPKV